MPKLSTDPKVDPTGPPKKVKRPDTPLATSPEPNFSYTQKFASKKAIQDKNEAEGKNTPGIKVTKGVATAESYPKKFIPASKNRSNASIVDGSGKTIKTSIPGSQKSRDDLYASFKSDSTSTMQSRNKNANYRNITTGNKKILTDEDKKTLVKTGRAKIS